MARLTGRIYIKHPLLFPGAGQPIIACQYLNQLPERLRTEMIATATVMAFRLGMKDARLLENQFEIPDQDYQLAELPHRTAYAKLEKTIRLTVPESDYPEYPDSAKKIRNRSRTECSVPREQIETKISDFLGNV